MTGAGAGVRDSVRGEVQVHGGVRGRGGLLRARVAGSVAAALAGVLVLAGCSGGGSDGGGDDAPIVHAAARTVRPAGSGPLAGLTPREDLAAANHAMSGLSAMTLDEVQQRPGHSTHLTAALTDGKGCALSAVVDGASVRVIGAGDRTYVKADPAYWRAHGGADGSRIAAGIHARWLRFDLPASATSFARYCSVSAFMAANTTNVSNGTVTHGRPTTLGGKSVLTVVHAVTGETATMRIASTGAPYILRSDIVGTGANAGMTGYATFGGFDRAPHISAPPAGSTVDLATFGASHLSV